MYHQRTSPSSSRSWLNVRRTEQDFAQNVHSVSISNTRTCWFFHNMFATMAVCYLDVSLDFARDNRDASERWLQWPSVLDWWSTKHQVSATKIPKSVLPRKSSTNIISKIRSKFLFTWSNLVCTFEIEIKPKKLLSSKKSLLTDLWCIWSFHWKFYWNIFSWWDTGKRAIQVLRIFWVEMYKTLFPRMKASPYLFLSCPFWYSSVWSRAMFM